MEPVSEDNLHRQIIREELRRITLYEGLLFSYPPSLIFPRLQRMGYDKVVSYNNSKNIFTIDFKLNETNLERYNNLNNFMDNVCGWHHGETINNGLVVPDKLHFLDILEGNVGLQYEAKFNIKVVKIPNKIYHLTTSDKIKKILNVGLTPKTSINYFTFSDRIYFSLNPDSLIKFSRDKSKMIEKYDYVVLEIDTNYFPIGMRFFKDPNFVGGMYTLENIPPEAITPIFRIHIDLNGNPQKQTL